MRDESMEPFDIDARFQNIETQLANLQNEFANLVELTSSLNQQVSNFINLVETDMHTAHSFCGCINHPLAGSTQKTLAIHYKNKKIAIPVSEPIRPVEASLTKYLRFLSDALDNGTLPDNVYAKCDEILKGYSTSNRNRRLYPGCVRFVTVPHANPSLVRHSMLILGELADHGFGSHRFVRLRNEKPVRLSGLTIPGQGAEAATAWLLGQGFLPPVETRVAGAGVTLENLIGESASLALALGLISMAMEEGVPDKYAPSARLEKNGDIWEIKALEDYDAKWKTLPEGCQIILSRDTLINAPEWRGKDAKNVIFVETLDDVINVIWPEYEPFETKRTTVKNTSVRQDSNLYGKKRLADIVLGLIVFELGMLQEWAPAAQHPDGFPGWLSPETFKAFFFALMAAICVGIGNHIVMSAIEKHRPCLKSDTLSLVGGVIYWLIIGVIAWAWLHPLTHYVYNPGGIDRSGNMQVIKVLMVLGLEVMILLWPSWNAAVWAKYLKDSRRYHFLANLRSGAGPYKGILLICPDTKTVLIVSTIVLTVLSGLDWISWTDVRQIGAGDVFQAFHMILQAFLMVVLAGVSWQILRYAEQASDLKQF